MPDHLFNTPLHTSLSFPSFYPSPADSQKVQDALKLSWAESTHTSYLCNIQHFQDFCLQRNIAPEHYFPTPESLLVIYAASHLGKFASSTIQSCISTLKAYHVIHNLEWNGSLRLTKILQGLILATPSSSIRHQHSPISLSMLHLLVKSLDLRSPLDAAVAACACTAFWGQCCLGELLPSSPNCCSYNPIRTHLTCSASTSKKPNHFNLFIPSTKTNRRGQTITLLPQPNSSNPLPLLQNHLAVNPLPLHTPLFTYVALNPSGQTSLTKETFLSRCNEIWRTKGYDRVTGHSFRIGGTTQLLSSGIPPDVIKTMGRWSSDSFLCYWRHLDRIAPAQTPKTQQCSHHPSHHNNSPN